eukprot:791239-Ditylum_brightwellii.AAC.1
MKLVALSKAVDTLDFANDGPHTSIVNEDLKRIDVGQTTVECLYFIDRLALLAAETQQGNQYSGTDVLHEIDNKEK